MNLLSDLSKVALLNMCKERGILKCSSKNKSQLIELLNAEQVNLDNQVLASNTGVSTTINHIKPLIQWSGHLKPLIKWSGGKSDEIVQFEKYIPAEYDTYIEPFVGGGSVYFYLNPQKAVISDVHSELTDLYQCIGQGKTAEIYDFMENSPNTAETYYKIRDTMPITGPIDNAKRFYYQRKTCFRGMSRYNKSGKFNIPFGKYKTINYSNLQNPKYAELLSRTEILNHSFETIFENYNSEHNFMFLDPPYDSEFTDYGYCKFGKEEQEKLAKYFKETKIKCLMIIGKTQFIEDLYKDYIVDEYDKKYKFKLYAGRVGDEINTKHLIIKNY